VVTASDRQISVRQVAIDAVAFDPLAHQLDAFQRQRPCGTCTVGAELLFENVIFREADDHLPAVASRCAPAGAMGIEHGNRQAACTALECNRKAGETGADHADVHVERVGKRGIVDRWARRGGFVEGVANQRVRALVESGGHRSVWVAVRLKARCRCERDRSKFYPERGT